MQADLIVAGMSERTQEAYLRAVRQLSDYYSGTLPVDLNEQQVKDYLLWLRSEKRAVPGTLRIAIGGLRFFYRQTHPVTWKVLDRFRIPKEKKLPNVLTVLEVRRIMHATNKPQFYAYFWTVYSCGLRLNEALALQVGDGVATYRKKQKRPDGEPSSKGPVRTMKLPAMEFLRRFLQHVLPRGFQRVRHYGFLSRTSKTDLDEMRAVILQSMRDSEPDLELIDWTVPVLHSSTDAGPKCPTCGELLTFESFIRIRPPPLEWRGRNSD